MIWLLALACAGAPEPIDTASSSTGTSTTTTTPPTDGMEQLDPSALPAGPEPCRAAELVLVTDIIDGDTARMNTEDGNISVRFIGIDTPEIGYDGDPSDCYAEEARNFAAASLHGKRVWLTHDAECVDMYDRRLAYVHTAVGEQGFFQRTALQGGYATPFAFEPNTTFEEIFEGDSQQANDAGAGMWSSCER